MLVWTLLAACTGTTGDPVDPTGGTGPTDPTGTPTPTEPGTTPTVTDPGSVTFHADVRPLLAKSCARCHTGTGFGPGSFLDYPVASSWAEVMVARIDDGEMPPPAADPTCHPYVDQEVYEVDPTLRDTLAAWIEAGKPEGEPPTGTVEVWNPASLPAPDLELRTVAPRVPDFDGGGNEYVCYKLGSVEQETYITGLEFLLDHPEISHHALLLVDDNADGNIEDPATGSWPCSVFDIPGSLIHAWAPSGGALEFPEGTGIRVPAGSDLVLQMHYFQSVGDVPADQPGYAFTTAPSVDKEMEYIEVGPLWFTIPAGDPSYTKTFSAPLWLLGLGSIDIWGVFPHMHVLGTAYDFRVEGNSGETCISRADEYDFTLQPTYWFDTPVTAQSSDSIKVSCTWDNSADNPLQFADPPQNVTWGENTQDEMCYGFFYATPH
jgi:hypothetical protein